MGVVIWLVRRAGGVAVWLCGWGYGKLQASAIAVLLL
jgi:hypothetical protein